jgi:hypothetical protein
MTTMGCVEVRGTAYTRTQLKGMIKITEARRWWLTPVILVTWEAEIRRIRVRGQPRQIVHKTSSPK